MTKVDEIMHVLNDAPRGLTANDLHVRTGVPKNVLGTYLWELKRDGYLQRVGGVRGSYRYGLTDRGRERIGLGDDPLRQLTRTLYLKLPPAARDDLPVSGDFTETMKVLDQLDEYRSLKRFAEWLSVEKASVFQVPDTAAPALHRAVLEYLGIDPTSYQKQSAELISLLEFMRETT